MATIRDVARHAGVGVGTASRVISGRGSVSKDAIERVNAAVAELGFRPSEIARALSSMSAGLVGVYVPDFHGAFFGPFLQTISHELRTCHRRMAVANGFGDGDERTQAIAGVEFLVERECDGILVFSNHLHDDDFHAIHRQQPKLAIINRHVPGLEENCFFVDHHIGGALAARALLSHGHRRFAVIGGPDSALDNVWRLDGFFAVLAEEGIARDSVPVLDGGFSFEGGQQAAQIFIDRHETFSALFCANDEMAMGAMSCLQENGVVVPRDVSVVGYDNTVMSAYTAPRLTTVSIPMREMGANGCRWLINQCFQTRLEVQRGFSIDVVWRASVAEACIR
ncbi:MAG: LacI family DNA-binding transcriptional regulator [Propionivibrio sp.]